MVDFRDECVSCDIPCISCGRKHVPVLTCDECGEEVEELYKYEGQELCEECVLESLEKVDINEL